VDRRRIQRTRVVSRLSLERALGTWTRLEESWRGIFDVARRAGNCERMALAEAKLAECDGEIVRIRTALDVVPRAT
jgi:hypothetical protein